MRVIIIGAGLVGTSIADELDEFHDVVIIEQDPDIIDEVTYSMDVLAINGDGTDVETLEEASVGEADMVIASTDNDETNVVACSTAKAISDAFTVARIKNTKYLRTWERNQTAFGIDQMVCTNLETAQTIGRVVGLPSAHDVDLFADGRIEMAEFEVGEDSPFDERTVEDADTFDSLTFAAIVRNGEIEIARGDTVIRGGDRVVVIGSIESVHGFAQALSPNTSREEDAEVVIIGGSEIGYQVARLLEQRGLSPRLIEQDRERARDLAESLPETLVMQSDATDMSFLEREHIGDADVLVSTLESDEKNLLECLLARRLGVERTVAVIDRSSYVDIFETVGVDVGLSPREVVAEEITRFTQSNNTKNISFIGADMAEIIEIEIDAETVLAGRAIQESITDLPMGVVIGAIIRGDDHIVPRGDTLVEPGDRVVLFVKADVIDEAAELL